MFYFTVVTLSWHNLEKFLNDLEHLAAGAYDVMSILPKDSLFVVVVVKFAIKEPGIRRIIDIVETRLIEESMAKTEKEPTLRGWQKDVIEAIDGHEEVRESEQYQQTSPYLVNRSLGIVIHMPPGSGHTFLARYIAEKYPAIVVYADMSHYKELGLEDSQKSETVSMHEIFFALNKPDVRQPSEELLDINRKIAAKKVVVVDRANKIHSAVKDYLYNVATGIVIMLG